MMAPRCWDQVRLPSRAYLAPSAGLWSAAVRAGASSSALVGDGSLNEKRPGSRPGDCQVGANDN
jgi:hypothetical protein